jgi:hypothetical protein
MARGTDRAMKTTDGSMERMILSNFSVKSKFPRHPFTIGPKEASFTHDTSMSRGSEWDESNLHNTFDLLQSSSEVLISKYSRCLENSGFGVRCLRMRGEALRLRRIIIRGR